MATTKLLANRVKESTTTSGTGNLTLAGAAVRFQSFNTAFSTGSDNKFYYWVTDNVNDVWEFGIGYLSTSTVLVRDNVLDNSSDTASAINFPDATIKEVFCAPGEDTFVRNNFTATTDPTANDDITLGYEVGSKWINVTTDNFWVCADETDTAAVWRKVIYDGFSDGGSLTGTWTDLGSVTTIDINGGTIDNTTIDTSDITVGSGKTLDVSAGTLTLANDQISGDKIDGGVISDFASTGIDDNATSNALTINSSQKALFSGDVEVAGATISANGNFSADGDAQSSKYVMRIQTTDGAAKELFLDGTSQRLVIAADTAWNFIVKIICREAATDDTKAWKIEGLLKRDGTNNTSIIDTTVDTVLAGDTGSAAWTATVSADDTNESLKIEVTGEAAHTINWVASIDLVEVTV